MKFHWPRGYKYQLDEAWKQETYPGKDKDKVWYQQIPLNCGGFICLYSLDPPLLKAWSTKQRKTARKIEDDYPTRVNLDTAFEGFEFTMLFPPDLLKEIAGRLGARRRRQLTPEQKEKLAEAGKAYHFKSSKAASNDSSTAQVE